MIHSEIMLRFLVIDSLRNHDTNQEVWFTKRSWYKFYSLIHLFVLLHICGLDSFADYDTDLDHWFIQTTGYKSAVMIHSIILILILRSDSFMHNGTCLLCLIHYSVLIRIFINDSLEWMLQFVRLWFILRTWYKYANLIHSGKMILLLSMIHSEYLLQISTLDSFKLSDTNPWRWFICPHCYKSMCLIHSILLLQVCECDSFRVDVTTWILWFIRRPWYKSKLLIHFRNMLQVNLNDSLK